MKTKILIIAFLIVSLLGVFSLRSNAQYSNKLSNVMTIKEDTVIANNKSELIADETEITYLKTEAKIVTYSDLIFDKLYRTWGPEFYSFRTKQFKLCNHIRGNKYIIYCSKQTGNNIREWANKNL